MKSSSFFAGMGVTALFVWLAVVAFLVIGWVINFFDTVLPPYPPALTVEFILQLIGIPILPVGGILGWF